MRLMLHNFRKDARRLWPAALVTWIMLFTLARADRWRGDWMPSPLEGWMTMLLTMAWACLAALAALEEPLVGDRNFWTTRPHRWPALLAAKLLFVVIAIHLPSFLADVYILASRGFSPAAYLPDLLWKQLLFFAAITLPSLAIASLVRSFTHFVIAAFTIAIAILILNGGFQNFPEFTPLRYELHHALVRILLASAALVVIWIQYARRRIIPARAIAIAAGLAAALVATWLPARAEYALGAASQTPQVTLRNVPLDPGLLHSVGDGQTTVLLPISIDPGGRTDRYRMPLIEIEITAPGGIRIQSTRPSPNRPYRKIDLSVYPFRSTEWLSLTFSSSAWERVKNARVHIEGTAAFDFYRPGQTVMLPAQATAAVPVLGRCTTQATEQNFSDGALKVECESPREIPPASVALSTLLLVRNWTERLNSAFTYAPGPHETWLSPLHRSQTFFPLTNILTTAPGSQWRVPASALLEARVAITPEISTGHALAHFDFPEVPLSDWLVPRRPR
ncbi:MAG: hypothetical protein P4L56_25470 [Candidatus Sulfopaludibacter sp.]|nr:hypothetical protein [Candidatus Sulfopaludibacter sp.]